MDIARIRKQVEKIETAHGIRFDNFHYTENSCTPKELWEALEFDLSCFLANSDQVSQELNEVMTFLSLELLREENDSEIRRCRVCGCTDDNCSQCVEKTGQPCHWVEDDLCSACTAQAMTEYHNS